MIDKTMATVQPMGQALQMPTVPKGPERRKAKATRRIRSVNVALTLSFFLPASAQSACAPGSIVRYGRKAGFGC